MPHGFSKLELEILFGSGLRNRMFFRANYFFLSCLGNAETVMDFVSGFERLRYRFMEKDVVFTWDQLGFVVKEIEFECLESKDEKTDFLLRSV